LIEYTFIDTYIDKKINIEVMSLVPFSLSRRSSLSRRNSLSRSSSMLDFWNRRPMLDFGPNFHDFNTIRDPFDEIDLLAGNDLMWLHRPSLIRTYVVPRQPEKYRVTVDCSGFNPNSIKTEVSGLKVIVTAREEQRQDSNNYTMREFKKSYDLPANSETEKLTSYVVGKEQLVIEVPLKQEQVLAQELYLHPVVSDDKKYVSMEFSFPEYLDPSKVSVVCKDNDLIIRAEDRLGTWDKMSQFSYYKRVTMPENTDFYELKCKMDKNVLSIRAPLYDSDFKKNKGQLDITNSSMSNSLERIPLSAYVTNSRQARRRSTSTSSSTRRAVNFSESTKM